MPEMLEQLKPIAEIIGPDGVSASYSGTALGSPVSGYGPGWEVEVSGTYRGASITFSTKAATIDDAAAKALTQLKNALGLT